jgi:hypothetical protein
MAKTTKSVEIDVIELKRGRVDAWILGETPFYCNRVAEKAKRELLLPRGRLTTAQRATHLKHDPIAEFRSSPYMSRDDNGATRIMMAAAAPKKAMAQAAIDMPTGVARTQINRLCYVPAMFIPIWGVPRLAMDIVRQADIARTPDVRTRARIDRWASCITIMFAEPMLNATKVSTLLAASGMLCGIGDWRQEKGGGSNGLFRLVAEDDPALLEIIANGGREQQDEAFANPICADPEAEDLLTWFMAELERRGKSAPSDTPDDDEVDLDALAGVLANGAANEAVI